ncbi:MAG: hypothetical protein ACFFC7_16210 [Candidatus Hermodarchaeota archaeon]
MDTNRHQTLTDPSNTHQEGQRPVEPPAHHLAGSAVNQDEGIPRTVIKPAER